ncbi:hypothetical protein LEMLEM_LOCUS3156, partial [Lemmus lemmus]
RKFCSPAALVKSPGEKQDIRISAGGEIPGRVVSGTQGFTDTFGTSVNFEHTTGILCVALEPVLELAL